jgi:hypothetical protein
VIVNDQYQEAYVRAAEYISDLPDRLSDFNTYQRALLISDNGSLRLDENGPTYPPTTEAASRRARRVEQPHRGGNYVNTIMAPLYTNSSIEASLTQRDASRTPSSHTRLARFCLMLSHIEWCYTSHDRQRARSKFLALKLYLLLTKLNVWPNEG